MVRALAEWEKQEMLLVALPHKNTDWSKYLDEIMCSYVDFITTASRYQKVGVVTPSKDDFKRYCSSIPNTCLFNINTNDTWIRDFGPINVLKNGEIISYNFLFNAWGGKFKSDLDNCVNHNLSQLLNEPMIDYNFILEGGSIDFNGNGVMLTTTKCLLNANRNYQMSKEQIDLKLKEIFGLKDIIWLENGSIIGDDTDSHVDTLARFIDKNTIAFSVCYDERDEHYVSLSKMKQELEKLSFNLIELPIPSAKFFKNKRLAATYVNFVFVNGALIVPIYNDKNDEIVLNRLKKHLPDIDVIGVDALVFLRENGSLHCSCQNKFTL